MSKRYGLIGTAYNAGISNIAEGFAKHLDMKTLLVDHKPYTMFPERFANARVTKEMAAADVEWLLADIDVLMAIETPYRWDIFKLARDRGIKVVLMPMIEWLDRRRPELRYVDLYLCASQYTADRLPKGSNHVLVPSEVPVDLQAFQAKYDKREFSEIKTFLHNGGHGGIGGRNSTRELMDAIPLVQSDVRFIIRSQIPLTDKVADLRIDYIEGNVKEYTDLYSDGDAWIMPWKYGVFALGLQESMAAGMVPLITNMEPFDEWVLPELLIEPQELQQKVVHAGQRELYAVQSPTLIARKIDEVASWSPQQIAKARSWAAKTAYSLSWYVWTARYRDIFDSL